MGATKSFELSPPTEEDLEVVASAWCANQNVRELPVGSSWCRVIRADTPEDALIFARTAYASTSFNRFSPVLHDGMIKPAAYATDRKETALWEVALRTIRHDGIRSVPSHETHNRYLVTLRLDYSLRMLDIRKPRDVWLVQKEKRPPDLTTAWPAAYHLTQQWAQKLYERLPGLDGILYESHQVRKSDCIVLYQPASRRLFSEIGPSQSLREEPIRSLLIEEAAQVGAIVNFGDDEDDEDEDDWL